MRKDFQDIVRTKWGKGKETQVFLSLILTPIEGILLLGQAHSHEQAWVDGQNVVLTKTFALQEESIERGVW